MKRLAIMVALALTLTGCATNSDKARYEMKQQSEDNYGVMRTVTAYTQAGEQIGQWHGKIDVTYAYDGGSESKINGRVDLVVFDGSEPVDRIVISNAIVIVDND